MSAQKPTLPKGTRDFSPEKMYRRNHILNTIKNTYIKYGFQPLETPAMESLSVLTGKYGDEGDQLIFKILNSGNYLEKVGTEEIEEGIKKVTPLISEKALRYDLTVPFARFVVMNRNEIAFPFKRYQIQPVWRADKPQKGRYREFYQCDADVVGTKSLLCEAEIILMIREVFSLLGILNYSIKINNRKILEGVAQLFDKLSELTEITVAIDKLDKIGVEGVVKELETKGLDSEKANSMVKYFTSFLNESTGIENAISKLKIDFKENNIENGLSGIEEINTILNYLKISNADLNHIEFDMSLARGLSYYTGTIFEVKANDVKMGSISGGGRYDNLTGVFGMPGVSGVGISFGVDRIYDVMEELNLFASQAIEHTKVLICSMNQACFEFGLTLLGQLREKNINSEAYPEPVKFKKQLEYAHKKNIPYVVIIGEEEVQSQLIILKDMRSGTQNRLSRTEIIDTLIN